MSEVGVLRSTGIGSWPGSDPAQAVRIAFAECPDLPYLPELPARGPHAALIGRGTAVLTGLGIELQAGRWRLSDRSGRDHRRAVSLFRADLDLLEETAQGYVGPVKIAVAGPWTLAAQLEHPRGDKVLADRGARRDLGQSLTQGLADLVTELQRRLPDVGLLVQLDEPSLPAVQAGGIATASGLHRHRSVDLPEISAAYSAITGRLGEHRVDVWVHSCAPEVPVGLLHRAGVTGVLLDLDQVGAREWDEIGPAMEGGLVLGVGAQPTDRRMTPDQVAEPGPPGAPPARPGAGGDGPLRPDSGVRPGRQHPGRRGRGPAQRPDGGPHRERAAGRVRPVTRCAWRS